jgi:N-acetyl-1-D-myo-inositol-2-amino-2-deoxy-alpha-D-glucopyranoside deacetylase
MNNSKNKYQGMTILAVLAHPDDETFGMGGTLALYARRGVSVHLICATRGEVGDVEPHFMEGFQSVGELREHELRCAAEILGLSGVHFLDYRDSGMPGSLDNEHPQSLVAAPLDEVAAKVTGYMRELRPQIVLTFDPIGGYRHPDHIAIHNATVKAFHAAGDEGQYPRQGTPFQPDKLYFHTFPRGLFTWMVRLLPLVGKDPRRFGRNGDINLLELSGEDFPVHARINYSQVTKEKAEATACHASQGSMGSAENWLVNLAFRLASGTDFFTLAYPEPHGNEKERDLFSKIKALE